MAPAIARAVTAPCATYNAPAGTSVMAIATDFVSSGSCGFGPLSVMNKKHAQILNLRQARSAVRIRGDQPRAALGGRALRVAAAGSFDSDAEHRWLLRRAERIARTKQIATTTTATSTRTFDHMISLTAGTIGLASADTVATDIVHIDRNAASPQAADE
jgi:hypothetical protein